MPNEPLCINVLSIGMSMGMIDNGLGGILAIYFAGRAWTLVGGTMNTFNAHFSVFFY